MSTSPSPRSERELWKACRTPSTFNLVKNIVGAGVLSLPAGVAAFSSSKVAVAPACALVMSLGLLSCYCFTLIGRLSAITGASTYRGAIHYTAVRYPFAPSPDTSRP